MARKNIFDYTVRLLALSFIISNGLSCTSIPIKEESTHLKVFSSDYLHPTSSQPLCKSLLDSYCTYLYSPDVLGNLEIRRSQNSTKVLQGDTQNQFSQVFFTYSQAKLRNQSFLPKDLYRVLNRHNYFRKLEMFLKRKPVESMSLSDRLEVEQVDYELGMLWSAAVNETIILRMNRKYPGLHRISKKLMPLELSLVERRTRRNLISEISAAVWSGSENWKKVELTFSGLRQSYLNLIAKLDIPDEIRTNWENRIKEVRLVLPGSLPAISNEECSTTKVNAYYYTYLNIITVCAGDFNSEDILQTLAHEMGHVLDVDRSNYLFQSQSQLGLELKALRHNVCSPEKISCEQWQQFNTKFSNLLESLNEFTPALPEFQRCLKRRPTSKTIKDEDIRRIASVLSNDRISSLAGNDRFLRITKQKIPMFNGKQQKNPNYLNPCSYYLWSQEEEPVDDEITTLMVFTAAYRCSNEPPDKKLRASIETARNMTVKIFEKTLKLEGEFSSRNELESEGFSSSPTERFADVIGAYAMSEYLSQLPSIWERRNRFLAGASWLCEKPSLASLYPVESSIEKEFVFDSHTEGDQRRKELFTTPIRNIIACEKDFQFRECSLPLK